MPDLKHKPIQVYLDADEMKRLDELVEADRSAHKRSHWIRNIITAEYVKLEKRRAKVVA